MTVSSTLNHGLLDPKANPTPAEAAKSSSRNKGSNKAHPVGTKTLSSTAPAGSGRGVSPSAERGFALDGAKLDCIEQIVKGALGCGSDIQEDAIKKIAEELNITLQKKDPSDHEELKTKAFDALSADLRPHAKENIPLLLKNAASKPEQHAAVVNFLVINEKFEDLVRFLQQRSQDKIAPERLAELEDQVFSTLMRLPKEVMMQGICNFLSMYVSRTRLNVQDYVEHSRADFGGSDLVEQRLFRLVEVYNKTRTCHKAAVTELSALDEKLAKRNTTSIPEENFTSLSMQTGASLEFFKAKGDAYVAETKQMQEARDRLFSKVQMAEKEIRNFAEQLSYYIETVVSAKQVEPVSFKNKDFTARFISDRLNDTLTEVNPKLKAKRQDINLSQVHYYCDPQPESLDDKAMESLLEKIYLELEPLKEKMRAIRASKQYATNQKEDLDKLLAKIDYFIEMRNFLAKKLLPENQRMLQSKADLEKMQSQPRLTAQELIRLHARTEWDSGLIAEKDKKTESRQVALQEFLSKHEANWMKATDAVEELDTQIDYLISMWNNNGKCPRIHGRAGKLATTNTQLPEGVKLIERVKIPKTLNPV